jgi:hypothetical protein
MGLGQHSTGHRVTRLVGALVLAFGGLSIGSTAAQADVAACAHPAWQNVDAGSGHVMEASVAVHNGPYADCGTSFYVFPFDLLYYHCWTYNGANTWTHLRISGTTLEGWVWDAHLDDGGATSQC